MEVTGAPQGCETPLGGEALCAPVPVLPEAAPPGLSRALRKKLDDYPFFQWLLDNYVLPKTRKPYSFIGHAYLIGITQDTHERVVVEKSAQCGISELAVAKGFYVLDILGLNTVYAMPAMAQMQQFSHGRVRRAINESPYLLSRVSGVTNVNQKEIGDGIMYLIGSQDYRQLITIDGDFLLIDELDGHLQENVAVLEQRVEHSELKWLQYQSTPTIPEYGINELYLESDCREWFLKCEHCGEWQTLTWEENVVELPTPHVVCRKCRKEMNRLAMGEWVPKHPSRSDDVHGYQINKLFCQRADIKTLWKRSKSARHQQQFYNSDLGLPWAVSYTHLRAHET